MIRPDADKRPRSEPGSAGKPPLATYQTRIPGYGGIERRVGDAALAGYAEHYGRVERKLFAEVAAGRSATSLKSAYLQRYGIPARMFNAVRVSLEGKAASVKEQQRLRRDGLGRQIARAGREIAKASERGRLDQVHQKRRRLERLRCRLWALEARHGGGKGTAVLRVQAAVAQAASPCSQRLREPSGLAQGLAGMPAATSSSCWAVVTRRRAASYEWPALPTTAR